MEWKATATVNPPFTCNALPIRTIPLILAGLLGSIFFTPAAFAFDLELNASVNNTQVRFFDLDGSGKLGAVMPNGNGVEYRTQASLGADGTVRDVGAVVNDALAADLNGDGALDFVTANANGNISVLISVNDGDIYDFYAPVNYATTATPSKLWALDLNGDGFPDVVTLNSGSISVFINDGSGQFAAATGHAVCGQALEMTTADLNGDGFPDLVFPCYGDTAVDVLESGGGSFSRTTLVMAEAV